MDARLRWVSVAEGPAGTTCWRRAKKDVTRAVPGAVPRQDREAPPSCGIGRLRVAAVLDGRLRAGALLGASPEATGGAVRGLRVCIAMEWSGIVQFRRVRNVNEDCSRRLPVEM